MKYMVGYIDFYNNNLEMVEVVADSEVDALQKGLTKLGKVYEGKTGFESIKTLEEAKEEAFNADSMIEVKQIKE